MGISIATAYRKIVEMSRMGLVLRLGRGAYAITPKGAFYVAAVAIEQRAPDHVLRAAIRRLKEDWGVADLADEEVEAYVRLVLIGLRRLGRPLWGSAPTTSAGLSRSCCLPSSATTWCRP
ncbi:MAG: hypothetical protein ACP5I3_07680 [Thermoproteus sp.]